MDIGKMEQKIADWIVKSKDKTNVIVKGDISPDSKIGKVILGTESSKIIIPKVEK